MEALNGLNPAQRAAVEHASGAALVIAGAGSGKTRVLTARVAWLLERGVPPERVLAFTFTNRAAREMRERIARVAGERAALLWVGTFHATAVRILRREAQAAGIPAQFAIYDREDQEGVLRAVFRRLELPEGAYRTGAVIARISDAKNALVDPEGAARVAVSPHERRVAEIYDLYQRELRKNGALDFDDLIAETVRLLRNAPELAERYRRRFEHVLVDEYQDTNHAQFRLVESLAAGHGNLFVVGDDDQSIYGWRGADLSNVLDFETTFPGAALYRLEQNYRSTGTILKAANAVIANNRARKGKTLWSEREEGARLRFALAADEADEARRVRGFLEERVRRGGRHDDVAVLYRTNAQSRALESELRHHRIPYEIVGGVSFFQRREVKDVLAYLRSAVNPLDAVAFWRVWNTPRRGLGPGVRARIEQRMAAGSPDPAAALRALAAAGELSKAARAGAESLLGVLDELRGHLEDPVDALFMRLLRGTGYLQHLEGSGDEDAADRRGNVEELVAAAGEFSAAGRGALADFLAETALLTDADRMAEGADRVLLLTAHNAKGLEFPAVVVAGLEEGLFPHASSMEDGPGLEEERRLFYVAITRAQDEVLLTAASSRRRFAATGGGFAGQVSRFVDEVPPALLEREVSAGALQAWRGDEGGGPRAGGEARAARRHGLLARGLLLREGRDLHERRAPRPEGAPRARAARGRALRLGAPVRGRARDGARPGGRVHPRRGDLGGDSRRVAAGRGHQLRAARGGRRAAVALPLRGPPGHRPPARGVVPRRGAREPAVRHLPPRARAAGRGVPAAAPHGQAPAPVQRPVLRQYSTPSSGLRWQVRSRQPGPCRCRKPDYRPGHNQSLWLY